jgi:hypothetical protein
MEIEINNRKKKILQVLKIGRASKRLKQFQNKSIKKEARSRLLSSDGRELEGLLSPTENRTPISRALPIDDKRKS